MTEILKKNRITQLFQNYYKKILNYQIILFLFYPKNKKIQKPKQIKMFWFFYSPQFYYFSIYLTFRAFQINHF